MFNQTIKNICGFFSPGKKNIFAATKQVNSRVEDNSKIKADIRLLYHRDINSIQTMETKPELMQHDWWIN